MGVILFIMVTGTLPYLGEANIKDHLYQHIKNKQPEKFWEKWTNFFKSQKKDEDEDEEDDLFDFASDDNQLNLNEEVEADSEIKFKIWLKFLYKIAFVLKIVYNIIRIVLFPILSLVWQLLVFCFNSIS